MLEFQYISAVNGIFNILRINENAQCISYMENLAILIVVTRSSRLIALHGDFRRYLYEVLVIHVSKHKPCIKSLS
jgi:hypothetical protein